MHVCVCMCVFIREDVCSKCHLYIRLISKLAPAIISVLPSGSSTKHILATLAVDFLHMSSLIAFVFTRLCVCVFVCDAVKGSIKLSPGRVSLSSFRFFAAFV